MITKELFPAPQLYVQLYMARKLRLYALEGYKVQISKARCQNALSREDNEDK